MDSLQTTVSEYITTAYTTIYTCPVRQQHVTVTWTNSDGPKQIDVKIEILVGEYWEEFKIRGLSATEKSLTFDFDSPYRYRVAVKRTDTTGSNGNCDFTILASA